MFPRSVLNELNDLAIANDHDPRLENDYLQLGPFMRGYLRDYRPIGSITENPIPRYAQLREAMSVVRDPNFYLQEYPYHYPELLGRWSQKFPDTQGGKSSLCWRVTWDVSIFSSIPEDELDLFCGLLFASSLMSMVRFHYGMGEHLGFENSFWGPAHVTFDEDLESCIRPVWGILSSVSNVVCPTYLPSALLTKSKMAGRTVKEGIYDWGVSMLIDSCRQQALDNDRPDRQSVARITRENVEVLIALFQKESRQRIDMLSH